MKTLSRTLYQNSGYGRIKVLFSIVLFISVYGVWGQNVTTKTIDPQTTANQNQAQTQTNAESQDTSELGEIESEELEAFDVSTIPEAVSIPDADWVFEVPVDVKNISPEITRMGIVATVFKFMKDGERVDFGTAQVRFDLTNGAFNGSVMIGVDYSEDMVRGAKKKYTGSFFAKDAEKYECWMYLLSPENNKWLKPSLKRVYPSWRMASPNNPFRWKTEPQALPENYAIGSDPVDPGLTGIGDAEQSQESLDSIPHPNMNNIAIPKNSNESSTGIGNANSENENN